VALYAQTEVFASSLKKI